jgi:hypothetical protein
MISDGTGRNCASGWVKVNSTALGAECDAILHEAGEALVEPGLGQHAFVTPHHVRRGEGVAGLELHAVAQMEDDGLAAILDIPRRGEARDDVAMRVISVERVIDVRQGRQPLRRVGRLRHVEHVGIGIHGDAQHRLRRCQGRAGDDGGGHRRQRSNQGPLAGHGRASLGRNFDFRAAIDPLAALVPDLTYMVLGVI